MKTSSRKSSKPVFILGLNEASCASAALLQDGKIIAAASEERFTRIKNHWGFPIHAIKFCCEFAGIKMSDFDLVVLSYQDPYPHFTSGRAKELPDAAPTVLRQLRDRMPTLEYHFPPIKIFADFGRQLFYKYYQPLNIQKQIQDIGTKLTISPQKIIRMNHHLAHATATYFANPAVHANPMLVMTCDGAGDNICATIYQVDHGRFKLLSRTPHAHSLGHFYAAVTSYLGLKAHEDEYKVMGLAPFAQKRNWDRIYQLFQSLLWVDGLQFCSRVPARHFGLYLQEKLRNARFDDVASAAQTYLEDRLVQWVTNAISQTGIKDVAFAGGVFLNVKANLEIMKRTKIRKSYFLPSPGDDTNAIGACYWGYRSLKPIATSQSLTNLYLGPRFSENEIYKAIKRYKKYRVTKPKNIEAVVAQLLTSGEIVARFTGRMEMGVRALGNRSILADPRRLDNPEKINQIIKMRDFWMPFAPTVLAEDEQKYIKNPKKFSSPHMILAFETTAAGQKDLAAAIHPFDKTVRPQVLTREYNPSYYDLIMEFKRLTGVGAILNTSFNLHGEPIVCTPADALSTFVRSGLTHLQLNNFLISKPDS